MSEPQGNVNSSLLQHIKDVPAIAPEVAQIEIANFEASIPASGSITQPTTYKVPSQYAFEIYGLRGYIQSPGDSVANFPLITFNVAEQGKRNIFGTDQSMASLLNILGPGETIWFPRSCYLVSPGGELKATFTRGTGWNGGTKLVGIQLIGGLVAPNQARR